MPADGKPGGGGETCDKTGGPPGGGGGMYGDGAIEKFGREIAKISVKQ